MIPFLAIISWKIDIENSNFDFCVSDCEDFFTNEKLKDCPEICLICSNARKFKKDKFFTLSSKEIGSSLISSEMIFEAVQCEIFRFKIFQVSCNKFKKQLNSKTSGIPPKLFKKMISCHISKAF